MSTAKSLVSFWYEKMTILDFFTRDHFWPKYFILDCRPNKRLFCELMDFCDFLVRGYFRVFGVNLEVILEYQQQWKILLIAFGLVQKSQDLWFLMPKWMNLTLRKGLFGIWLSSIYLKTDIWPGRTWAPSFVMLIIIDWWLGHMWQETGSCFWPWSSIFVI